MFHLDYPVTFEGDLFRDVLFQAREPARKDHRGGSCYGVRVDVVAAPEPGPGFDVYAAAVMFPPDAEFFSNAGGDYLPLRIAIARLYEWCEWRDGEPWIAMTATVEPSDFDCCDFWKIQLWYKEPVRPWP